MQPADAMKRFVESLGRHAEAEFWLKLFRAEAKERFATLMIEQAVIEHGLDAVVMDLRFLTTLELTPIVCLGFDKHAEGLKQAKALEQGLAQAQVHAQIFRLQTTSFKEIIQATHQSCLPIVVFESTDETERISQLSQLLTQIKVQKLIFLTKNGALLHEGIPVPIINLTTEFDQLKNSPELSPEQQVWLNQAHQLIQAVSHKLLISVTSPLDLLRELFTVKGAGTMVRKGSIIEVKNNYQALEEQRLAKLLHLSFGRPASREFFARPISRIYLEENYRGAALVVETHLGGYLSKFAVERQAQGEGLGRDLWARLLADYPTLFWRSRAQNPINTWYMKEADGFLRHGKWHIFLKNVPVEKIPEAVAYALLQPDDMGDI